MEFQPPRRALKFLRWFCRDEFLGEIEGDLWELYALRTKKSSKHANRHFWWDVIRSFRPMNFKRLKINNWTMYQIKNYSKVYFRRFRKDLQHYVINILGLALGFSVLLFISMYAYNEFHIDDFYSKKDNIYRVVITSTDPEKGTEHHVAAANPLAEALVAEFPEIKSAARMYYLGSCTLQKGENMFAERKYALADFSLFEILDFQVVDGDPLKDTAIGLGIVLTETTAKRLFNKIDVAGEYLDSNWSDEPIEVLAVIKDMNKNSSYQFNAIFLSSFTQLFGRGSQRWLKRWDSRGGAIFALFEEGASPTTVLAQKSIFIDKYIPEEDRAKQDFSFQPISDIHLKSNHIEDGGNEPRTAITYGNEDYLKILLAIGFLVMIIAAFNYINLSSVQALKRTHEAGVRKVNGATMGQLRFQLYLENFWTLLIAYILGLAIVFLLFNSFLNISNKSFGLSELVNFETVVFQMVLFMVIWIFSSIIPAFYYSKLTKSLVLVKNVFSGKGDWMRRAFVTVQYGISLLLVVGSIILYQQLNYVQNKNLGFDNSNLITLDINSGAARRSFKEIVRTLNEHPDVVSASASSRVPGEWKWNEEVKLSLIQGQNELKSVQYSVDQFWLQTYGITLIEGNNFSGMDKSDTLKVIMNETAVARLGLKNPIGKTLWVEEDTISKMQIIGVVNDFHLESLHQPISPVVLTSWNNPIIGVDYFTIRYSANPSEVLAHIEDVQTQFDPTTPAELNFLDERWARYYKDDISKSNLILIATVISIVISIFGLFGLVNFSVERRTKEMGIRKVMGANVSHIIGLVLKDYLVLMGIALVIATPVAYWFLNEWLSSFTFRISLNPIVFVIAFIGIAVVSFLTVISRVLRLAKSNPVNSLKYE